MRYVPAACAVLCLLTMLQPSRAFSRPLDLDAIQANESSGHSYGLTISLKRLSSLPVRLEAWPVAVAVPPRPRLDSTALTGPPRLDSTNPTPYMLARASGRRKARKGV
jgi:hypothetical protein